jgi:hypothetical protein
MKCRNARALVDAYLDGALDEKTRALVEAHLETCGPCRSEFEEVRRYRDAVAGLPRVKVPDDFLGGIHDRLGEEPDRRRVRGLLFQPLSRKLPLEIAAAAVAVFALVFVFHSVRPKIEEHPEHAPVYPAAPESRAAGEEKTMGGEKKSRSEAREDAVERPAGTASSARAARPAEHAQEPKKAEAGAKSAPRKPASPAPPLEISVSLERPLQAGAARGIEAAPRSKAAFDTEAGPGTQVGPDTKAAADNKMAFDTEASSVGGAREPGETTDTRLKRVLGELVRIIEDAGGTVIGSEAKDESSTTLAVIPYSGLQTLLDYLGRTGQIKTDRALALPGPEAQSERVELQIRLTYPPQEDSGGNTGIR